MNEADAKESLTRAGGLCFCKYHLPFSKESLVQKYGGGPFEDTGIFKKAWSPKLISKFSKDIQERLERDFQDGAHCGLTGTVFPGDFSCNNQQLPSVSFADCHFAAGAAYFSGTSFTGNMTTFRDARFSGEGVSFDRAVFLESVADFANVTMATPLASFGSTVFKGGYLDMTNADVGSTTLIFSDAKFLKHGLLLSCNQHSESDGAPTMTIGRIFLNVAKIEGRATFDNRAFTDGANFMGTQFLKAPSFFGASLHQNTIWPPLENFSDTESIDASRAYRTLRLAMKKQDTHDDETMFWALEQRSKRNEHELSQPKEWLPWVLSWGYDILSNYGLNAGLPARWLGGWVIYSTVIYACVAGSLEKLASLNHWLGALGFSIAQMARPFFIWGDYDGSDIKAALGSNEFSFLIKILATMDSIVSLTLIALFILAVRRRFRMQ